MSPGSSPRLPSRDPTCSICGRPIRPGELVVFMHGDLYHLACSTSQADATERVAQFLRGAPGGMYCNVCIATACTCRHADVVKATTQLRIRPDFRVAIGARCTGCGNTRITVGIKPGHAGPRPAEG